LVDLKLAVARRPSFCRPCRSRRFRVAGACVAFLIFTAVSSRAQPAVRVLDVPYIAQSEALCGGAAAAMVLRYWGERGLNAESFSHLVDRSAAGIPTTALVGDLKSRGWNALELRGSDALLERQTDQGRPVMVLLEDRPGTFHYVVVVAMTPSTVLFHDPARAPYRALARDEFDRRWAVSDRWMGVITPASRREVPAAAPRAAVAAAVGAECQAKVVDAGQAADAGDFVRAEAVLGEATSCPAAVSMRELAGIRARQRRWAEAADLAGTAAQLDPADDGTWRLLATARFLQDDKPGALTAWNRAGEPRLDTVQIDGMARTRVPVALDASGLRAGTVLTDAALVRARRRLAEVPAVAAVGVEYVPLPKGAAEVRAHVTEQPLWPTSLPALASLGGRALMARELFLPVYSAIGGGERVSLTYRFWHGRPRVALDVTAPAPWGGQWGALAAWERQPFDVPVLPTIERRTARLTWSDWLLPALKITARSGADRWTTRSGAQGMVGGTALAASGADRMRAQIDVDAWFGSDAFTMTQAVVRGRSSAARRGLVLSAEAGAGWTGAVTPPDMWFGGDTGQGRPVFLRAHRLVEDGLMVVDRIGRTIVHGGAEAQYWRPWSRFQVAPVVFVDVVHLDRRAVPGTRGDVDVGAGVRLAGFGGGVLRLDLARGLRDGDMRVSAGFQP
jgi:predicted double-glycine peptidase